MRVLPLILEICNWSLIAVSCHWPILLFYAYSPETVDIVSKHQWQRQNLKSIVTDYSRDLILGFDWHKLFRIERISFTLCFSSHDSTTNLDIDHSLRTLQLSNCRTELTQQTLLRIGRNIHIGLVRKTTLVYLISKKQVCHLDSDDFNSTEAYICQYHQIGTRKIS